jgi:hypothetical protein
MQYEGFNFFKNNMLWIKRNLQMFLRKFINGIEFNVNSKLLSLNL